MAIAEVPRFVRADGPDKVTGSGRYATHGFFYND